MDTTTNNQSEINLQDPIAVRRAGLDALRTREIRDYTAERDALEEDISLEEAFEQVQALDALRSGQIRDYTAERDAWLDGISREELITEARALDALRRSE
jgi:hypothetical protein